MHGEKKLVGRDRELNRLAALLAGLAEGRGHSLLIEGEPGIGKSSLIAAAVAAAEPGAVELAHGECDELGRLFPLSVMLTALGVDPGSAHPLRAETAVALAGPARRTKPGLVVQDGGEGTLFAVERLMDLVDRLCAARPMLLAIDDLQSADEASLLLWLRLSRAVEQLPLLMIGACRPHPSRVELDELRQDLTKSRHGDVVSLERLDDEHVLEFSEISLGRRPGPGIARLLETAGGNPLYIREILDATTRSGRLVARGGVADISAETGAPEWRAASLTDAIVDRLTFLTAECRDLLQTAAVRGIEFTTADIEALTGSETRRIASVLKEAVRAGVLEDAERVWRFRHGLIRQALYDSVPEAVRLAMHRDLALYLIGHDAPPRQTAQAVLDALPVADGWELDWLAANIETVLFQAPATAVELLEHAVAHNPGTDPRIAALADRLPSALLALGRWEQAEHAARRILAETVEPERRGQAAWDLARALNRPGHREESLAFATAEAADPLHTPLWRLRLKARQTATLRGMHRMDEAVRIAQEVLEEDGLPGRDPYADSTALVSLVLDRMNHGDMDGALECSDRALELVGDLRDLSATRVQLLALRRTILEPLGRYAEARANLNSARALAEQTNPGMLAVLHTQAADIAIAGGAWDDALAELDAMRDLPGQGHQQAVLLKPAFAALVAVHRGEAALASEHLRDLDNRLRAAERVILVGEAARALAAEQSGDPARAVEILAVLIRRRRPVSTGDMIDWMPYLTRVALSIGDTDTAGLALDTARRQTLGTTNPYELVKYEWCRGLVGNDPTPVLAAAGHFRRANHFRLELGNAHEDAAFLLAANGEPERAKENLIQALTVYGDLGAAWDSQRALARLRTQGVRLGVRGPRRRARTGWEALSDTEQRVALLVADGLSNPEIAARLLLSRRTVQTHVSHIMTKLEVYSRRDIKAPDTV